MSALVARINALPPAQAARVLNAVTRARVARGVAISLAPDTALADALAAEAGADREAGASAGEVATAALQLLADDPAMTAVLTGLVENPPAEDLADPVTLGVGIAAVVVLQAYIKIERDKAGKWTFKFEKQPLSDSLLKHLISKLGGWLRGG